MRSNELFTATAFVAITLVATTAFAQQGVGIDVPNPLEKLDVNGAIKIGTDINNSSAAPSGGAGTIRFKAGQFEGWDGASWIPLGGGADNDWTVSGNTQYSAVSGDVGIGTAVPHQKVHIHDGALTWLQITNTGSGSAIGDGLLLGISSANEPQLRVRENWPLVLMTNDNERMRIQANGNVGIGTSTTPEKLTVNGKIQMQAGATTGYIPVSDANGTMTWTNPTTISTANDGDWTVSGNDQYSAVSGNVGIGTTTPAQKLHVAGSIQMVDGNQQTGYIPVSDANGKMTWTAPSAIAGLNELADADNDTKIQVEEGTDDDIIRFDLAGTEAFRMERTSSSNVPTLHVAENSIYIGDNLSPNVPLGFNVAIGANSATALTSSSSGNTFVGSGSGRYSTDATNNTYLGLRSGLSGTTAAGNVVVGAYAAEDNVDGNFNVILGAQAAYNKTSGNNNVLIGTSSGENSGSGAGNVFIGFTSGRNETGSNKLYIENTQSSSPLIYGEFDNNVVGINGNLGVGTQSPSDKLHVEGSIRMVDGNQQAGYIPVSDANGKMTWTSPSSITTAADGDGSSTNELQTLSQTGLNVSLSNGGGTISVADNDNSTTNELQTLSQTGLDVTLSNGGGTITVDDGDWTISGSNVYRNTGNVGMGTTTPTQGKLVVNGTGSSGTYSYGYLNSGGNTGTSSNQNTAYSIWASDRIRAAEFNAMSDARAKTIIQRSEKAELLALVNELQVTEYAYIDSLEHGTRSKQGFIAQEIEQVYPNAINKATDYIPNVFARSTKISYNTETQRAAITVEKPHALAVGDKLKLMTNDETLEVTVEDVANANTFSVKMETVEDAVFVYGKQVNDFRAVDYDQLFSIGIGAIQELSDKVEALETENAALKAELHTEKTSNEARLLRIEEALMMDAKAQR